MKNVEISLKEMLLYVLRRWKVLLLIPLIIALVVAGFSYVQRAPASTVAADEISIGQVYTLNTNIELTNFKGTSPDSYHITLATNDLLSKLQNQYLVAFQGADLEQLLGGIAPVGVDEETLEQAATVTVPSIGMLAISIDTGVVPESKAAATAIYEHLLSFKDSIARAVTEHNLAILTEVLAETPTNSETDQTASIDRVSTSPMRGVVIGLLGGLVLAVLLLAILYLLRPTVQTPDVIQSQIGIPHLGGVQGNSLADKLAGKLRMVSKDEAPAFIAANIADVSSPGARLLLTGSLPQQKIAELAEKLQPSFDGSEITLSVGGDVNNSVDTVHLLDDCDAVIMVEGIDQSTLKNVYYQKDRMEMADKAILGYVLI